MNKFNITELGECDVSGFISVDYAAKHEIGVNNTVVHEYIHNQLFQKTYYGIFINLLDIISRIDEQYLRSAKLLHDNMVKVQEATATFMEYISYYRLNGKDKFEKKIDELRKNNRCYYKYIEMLIFLFDEDRIELDLKIKLVMFLAYNVLSIDLTEIDKEIIKNGKKLEKFIVNQNNNYKYFPTTRFNLLIKELKKYLKEVEYVDNKNIEKMILTNDNVPVFSNEEKSVENIIDYFKELAINSKYSNEIINLISKMKIVDQNASLSGISIRSLNLYNESIISYKDFIKINIESDIPIVAFLAVNVNESKLKDTLRDNFKNGISPIDGYKVMLTSVQNEMNYQIKDLPLGKIINDRKVIKVIDIMSYFYMEKTIRKLAEDSGQEIYINSSLPYDYISLYFKKFIENKYKYRMIQYENFNEIIVFITEKIRMIIPIETIAGMKFFDDLATEKCKFEFIGTTDDEPYDEFIFRKSSDIFIYDTIINAYLQSELLKK